MIPNNISMSPVVKNVDQKLMTFPEAILNVTNGKKIHKLEWKNKEFYGVLDGGVLRIHKPDGIFYDWIINDGDLTGADWIVIV